MELREAISRKLERDNDLTYDPGAEIIVTAGVSEAALITFMALLAPGDEVIIIEPAWPHYAACAKLSGARPVGVSALASQGFIPDVEAIQAAVTDRTRLLIVNSPNNPTGSVYSAETLAAIGEIARRHRLLIISDEIYENLVYEGKHASIGAIEDHWSRTITFNGFSKAYSMTGWRIGYVAAPRPIADVVLRVHQYNTVCVTTFAQFGAVEAYNGDQVAANAMREEFCTRRALVLEGFARLPGIELIPPKGSFYVFPGLDGDRDADEFCRFVLEETGIATVPGSAFGAKCHHHFRLSYAASEDTIREAVNRLTPVMARLANNAMETRA
jgi:aspartate/methionine/tyrosine aminotransferase